MIAKAGTIRGGNLTPNRAAFEHNVPYPAETNCVCVCVRQVCVQEHMNVCTTLSIVGYLCGCVCVCVCVGVCV